MDLIEGIIDIYNTNKSSKAESQNKKFEKEFTKKQIESEQNIADTKNKIKKDYKTKNIDVRDPDFDAKLSAMKSHPQIQIASDIDFFIEKNASAIQKEISEIESQKSDLLSLSSEIENIQVQLYQEYYEDKQKEDPAIATVRELHQKLLLLDRDKLPWEAAEEKKQIKEKIRAARKEEKDRKSARRASIEKKEAQLARKQKEIEEAEHKADEAKEKINKIIESRTNTIKLLIQPQFDAALLLLATYDLTSSNLNEFQTQNAIPAYVNKFVRNMNPKKIDSKIKPIQISLNNPLINRANNQELYNKIDGNPSPELDNLNNDNIIKQVSDILALIQNNDELKAKLKICQNNRETAQNQFEQSIPNNTEPADTDDGR